MKMYIFLLGDVFVVVFVEWIWNDDYLVILKCNNDDKMVFVVHKGWWHSSVTGFREPVENLEKWIL